MISRSSRSRRSHPARALAFVTALALLGAASPAAAKVLVLTFRGPNAAKLQAAVASSLAAAGRDASPSDTSFEDAAILLGCDPTTEACAAEVLSTLSVEEVVYGAANKSGEVVLVRVVAGQPRRTSTVRIDGEQPLEAALEPGVRELYADEATPVAPPAPAPAPESAVPPPAAGPPAGSWSTDAPTASSSKRWALVLWGGAGTAALAGMGFWLHASSLRDDLDSSPDETAADRQRLDDLQSRAETSATLGNVLVVTSAGLAGAGAYFWIKHRRLRRDGAISVLPVLRPDGAGLVLTMGLR